MTRIWYRLRRAIWRYFRWRDVAQVAMAGAMGALAVNTFSVSRRVTIIAGSVYVVGLLVNAWDALTHRLARDFAQSQIVWELFDRLNREIFGSYPGARFTLFRIPPFANHGKHIVPWYRYRVGGHDPIHDAETSKARYGRGESVTGAAWEQPGILHCEFFPEFKTVNEFRTYYKDALKLSPRLVESLSSHMACVRTIFSYGFVDPSGVLLAVLSLDLDRVAATDGKPATGDIAVDSEAFLRLLQFTSSVLHALNKIERAEK